MEMEKSYYLIGVSGGTEPFTYGPYPAEGDRDDAARQIHETQHEDDTLFWADIDEAGRLTVGPYQAGFFPQ
jgi:hypothetical protein